MTETIKDSRRGIGFKNFRRFIDFPILQFGEITYMVGRNNAGKSTMVKALLLITDYINNQLGDTFAFDNEVLEDANIVTFGRAKNTTTKDPSISFLFQLGNYECELTISGDREDTVAKVDTFIIKNIESEIDFTIDYLKRETTIKKSIKSKPKTVSLTGQKDSLEKEIEGLEAQLTGLDKNSREGLTTIDRINRLKNFLNQFPKEEIEERSIEQFELSYALRLDENVKTEENDMLEVLKDAIDINNREYRNMIDEENVSEFESKEEEVLFKEKFEKVKAFDNDKKGIIENVETFINRFEKEEFYYLGANPSKQSALFPLRDKSNALAQAIHEFYQLKIKSTDVEGLFVKHWMKEFEVGDDFSIEFFAGEAYEFYVSNDGSKNYLADKGMGSLQAMMLILRIASLIRKNKKEKKNITILVEEPELNLHPALQSKLTELFHVVNRKYNFKFIVETHSEYIIRKSQVIVNKEKYGDSNSINPNPFKVYYYPLDEPVYDMRYREDGKFIDEFKSGFIDVSSNLTFEIL